MAEIDGDLRNRQYHVEQLAAMNVSDVKFTPFKYQLSPSLPVKKDGPGKAVIIIGGVDWRYDGLRRRITASRDGLA